jgi:thioredoxin reductase (NADPH)
MPNSPIFDVVVIGSGPGGATAALYAARAGRSTLLLDGGSSRTAAIALSRNHAGAATGLKGEELLASMRAHAER